ncbi:MAG: hypothetical protein P8Y70_15920 [Candidatus Lokiarchaeota archaeon]
MLFQLEPLLFILWLILATVIVTLILFISVTVIESKVKAKDKIVMIIILAFIIVLVLPIVIDAVRVVLSAIGGALASLRDLIDNGGVNYLPQLAVIIGFLLLLFLTKSLLDIKWTTALWVSLLTLFILYLIYCVLPELYTFLGFSISF